MTDYQRQLEARYEVAEELYKRGYDVVVSHDKGGHIDVVALSDSHIKLILVRRDTGFTVTEGEALIYAKAPKGHTQREIWTKQKGRREWTATVL